MNLEALKILKNPLAKEDQKEKLYSFLDNNNKKNKKQEKLR